MRSLTEIKSSWSLSRSKFERSVNRAHLSFQLLSLDFNFRDRIESFKMSGCFENLRLPQFEWLQAGDRRNRVAAIVAGILVTTS